MSNKSVTVRETARLAGVTPDVVRYYSRIGLIKPYKCRKNGYRLYDKGDVAQIIFIRKAKSLGYTLKEISKIISHSKTGASPCPIVRRIIESRINTNRRRLNEMLLLQDRMEKAVKHWKKMPDGIPDGNSICILIETFSY